MLQQTVVTAFSINNGTPFAAHTGILDLPPELLLSVLENVMNMAGRMDYQISVLKRANYHALFPISLSHSRLRRACIAAGMFSYIKPAMDLTSPASEETCRNFGKQIYYGCGSPWLTALMVDLSDPHV